MCNYTKHHMQGYALMDFDMIVVEDTTSLP